MNTEAARHLIRNRNYTIKDATRACTSTENEYQEMVLSLKNEGLISRKQAAAEGKIKYFTGKSCKYGHVAERYVSIGKCVECNKIQSKNNQDEFKKLINAARSKLITITVSVHPEDSQSIKEYAAILNNQREIRS